MLLIEELMNGTMFMSNTDLMMDNKEKHNDIMGIEGRQATLPKLSSTQEDERD